MSTVLPQLPLPTSTVHPAVTEPDNRAQAIEAWLRAGRDPHQAPTEARDPLDDQTPWGLLLPMQASLLNLALDLGAEPQRPVRVNGGWVLPHMVILAGPLEESAAKIRKLKVQVPSWRWDERWPGATQQGDAVIHLVTTARFSDSTVKPKLAEKAIQDLLEETVGNDTNLILMRDAKGQTGLHRALAMQRYEVAATLLQWGPQVQALARDHQGRSPLHLLAENPGNPREALGVIRTLLSHGIQWDTPDDSGLTPAQIIVRHAGEQERDAWLTVIQRTGAR